MSDPLAQPFDEEHAEFYDLEYFLSMEYRYFSGAHGSRVRHILAAIGDVRGQRCLEIGCGGGYFTHQLTEQGAIMIGIDYAPAAIQFGKSRYPHLDLRVHSALDVTDFGSSVFDCVTLLDTIEHISDHQRLLAGIHAILKPGGRVVISTDADGSPWDKKPLSRMIGWSQRLSAEGRAYRLIKQIERHRRQTKDYHASHIANVSADMLNDLLVQHHFKVIAHDIYPQVGVPLRDVCLRLLPPRYRGDHQTIVAVKPAE